MTEPLMPSDSLQGEIRNIKKRLSTVEKVSRVPSITTYNEALTSYGIGGGTIDNIFTTGTVTNFTASSQGSFLNYGRFRGGVYTHTFHIIFNGSTMGSIIFWTPPNIAPSQVPLTSGNVMAYDYSAGTWYQGSCVLGYAAYVVSPSTIGSCPVFPYFAMAAGPALTRASATVPFTWAYGDELEVSFTCLATRI